ncbi:MAG: hypothetical protein E7J15_03935 [Neisseria sp.]|jgi:hypothetical protein|uniref:hypothetical protein n=1 Tax=Neisseria subflava TaxID=28449 RepID=UPI002029C95C|nr:hypothetical protein [Neisseria subflava]MCL9788029.1 hypothetical protein [Neisseria subflava]MDU8022902.1 hypothetical protein [Neisseria sp.]
MNIEYLLDILKDRGYISIQDDRNLHGRASSDHLLSELRKNDKSGMKLEKYGMYRPTELVDIYWIQNDTHEDIHDGVLDMKNIMEDIYLEELHKLQQDM